MLVIQLVLVEPDPIWFLVQDEDRKELAADGQSLRHRNAVLLFSFSYHHLQRRDH